MLEDFQETVEFHMRRSSKPQSEQEEEGEGERVDMNDIEDVE